jgi:SpoVK/Ycf46/Vps4 family AAA+-type ATPase
MATARQIIALLNSLNQGDEEQFFAIALQVAAAEAKRGRRAVADELRVLVEQGRDQKILRDRNRSLSDVVIPITKLRGELQNLLTSSYPKAKLEDLVLKPAIAERLVDVVGQQREREELRRHGLVPTSTLLLTGPPGSGKTLTASALAGELHLPLYAVRFDSVITRFMGETSSKLRLVFDHIASTRGVYLFDEFDAIGSKRTADNDIGEIRRVLNSFLQFLEEPKNTDSLILCATNHSELLDRALFRRFDEVIEYGLPDQAIAHELLATRLNSFGFDESWWTSISDCVTGLSHAELVAATQDVMKHVILAKGKSADVELLRDKLERRIATHEAVNRLDK